MVSDAPEPTRRAHVQREHAFQGIVDRFLDRVLLPPCFVTGINHENELTNNAFRRVQDRGRGIKAGIPDIFVCQHPGRVLWLELKWGDNGLSGAQSAVRRALMDCGIQCQACWSIGDVLYMLRAAGMCLHGNADNLAVEYQARAEAAVAKAEARAATPRKASKPRPAKPSAAAIRRAHQAGVWR